MYVETWRRAPVMPTYCRPSYAHDSYNVATMRFVDASGANVAFKYTQDHTKMAIAVNASSSEHYVCIGDMNRMSSQWARGGGSVCFRHAATYASLLDMITGIDACP